MGGVSGEGNVMEILLSFDNNYFQQNMYISYCITAVLEVTPTPSDWIMWTAPPVTT